MLNHSSSPSSVQLTDVDRTGQLPVPRGTDTDLGASVGGDAGEDVLSAASTGRFPELGDLGDEDIIADGGTQIMTRDPAPPENAPVAISAKPAIPKAPETARIEELDADDLEDEEEQRRIERTQPFDRSRLFGAPRAEEVTTYPNALQGAQSAAMQSAAMQSALMPASPMQAAPMQATMQSALVQPSVMPAPQHAPMQSAHMQAVPMQPSVMPAPLHAPMHAAHMQAAPMQPSVMPAPQQATMQSAPIHSTMPSASMQVAPVHAASASMQVALAQTVTSTPPPAAPQQPTSQAWRAGTQPRLDLALSPTPAPVAVAPHARAQTSSLPSVVINEQPQPRLASISPVVFDVTRPGADATQRLAPQPMAPRKSRAPIIAAAIVGAFALCTAAAVALIAVGSDDTPNTGTTTVAAAKPREAQKGTARSAVIETAETTPQKADPPPGTRDEDGTPVFSTGALPSAPAEGTGGGSHHAVSSPAAQPAAGAPIAAATPTARTATATTPARSAKTSAPAAAEPAPSPVAAAPAPAPAPAPARAASTTGVIEVPSSLMTVMVDGTYQRVQGGRITVSCGRHRVNAGRGTQNVDVPCGGVASVM